MKSQSDAAKARRRANVAKALHRHETEHNAMNVEGCDFCPDMMYEEDPFDDALLCATSDIARRREVEEAFAQAILSVTPAARAEIAKEHAKGKHDYRPFMVDGSICPGCEAWLAEGRQIVLSEVAPGNR